MKNAIRRWLGIPTPITEYQDVTIAGAYPSTLEVPPVRRIEVINAVNGQILQMGTYKSNPHGPDWTFKLYIVDDSQSLPEAIAAAMVVAS
jgi:hypothetical protein